MMMLEEGTRAGTVIEYNETDTVFMRPSDKRTEDYVTGRLDRQTGTRKIGLA